MEEVLQKMSDEVLSEGIEIFSTLSENTTLIDKRSLLQSNIYMVITGQN